MKLLIKTDTNLIHVNAAIDILIPTLKTIADLGTPTVNRESRQIWVRHYEGKHNGMKIEVILWINKIKGGISITGSQETIPIPNQDNQNKGDKDE